MKSHRPTFRAALDQGVPERLYWMCAQVQGRDVLDVGCGDAEATLLLAREGHHAIGVDADRDVIDGARAAATAARQSVQRRVEFKVGEAGGLPFTDDRFDSVLLGDLLDRQVNRLRPIAEAGRVLRAGGRLIVTAAYGVGSDPTQRQPIRLDDLLDELGSCSFSVAEIALIADHVCIVATLGLRRGPKAWRLALAAAEQRLEAQSEMLDALTASAAEARAGEDQARKAGAQERERARTDSEQLERLEAALAAATHERDSARGTARIANEGVTDLQEAVEQIDRERIEDRAITEANRERAVTLARDLEATSDQLTRHEEQLVQRKEELERSQAVVQEQERRLAKAQGALGERERELGSLRDAFERHESALARARDALNARDAELSTALGHLRAAEMVARDARAKAKQQKSELLKSEASLTQSELRAERLATSLEAIRAGRAYRLMRAVWRLRRLLGRG